MRPLPKPTFSAEEVFRISISKVRDEDLKTRLEGCIPEIITDSVDFDNKATTAQLHQITKKTHVNGNVTKDEMIKVYTGRMVNKKGPGRRYYEKLRYPKGHDKCPLCGQLPIKSLDHYLAKTDYPTLAVSPNNLVPACKDCNEIKSTAAPTKSEEETLHPYFDNIDGDQWLYAKVLQTSPVSFSFYINPPTGASPILAERVKYHFKLYKLDALYKTEAATEVSDMAYRMSNLLIISGPQVVQQHLAETANSCFHSRKNSWKTAMYQALAADSWYCNIGAGL